MKLPDICWSCACTVVDDEDNEWVIYVDVGASTKSEAHELAESKMLARGLILTSATIMAAPERRPPDEPKRLPAPEVQEPPAPPVPFFETAFFTKYADITRYGLPAKEVAS